MRTSVDLQTKLWCFPLFFFHRFRKTDFVSTAQKSLNLFFFTSLFKIFSIGFYLADLYHKSEIEKVFVGCVPIYKRALISYKTISRYEWIGPSPRCHGELNPASALIIYDRVMQKVHAVFLLSFLCCKIPCQSECDSAHCTPRTSLLTDFWPTSTQLERAMNGAKKFSILKC